MNSQQIERLLAKDLRDVIDRSGDPLEQARRLIRDVESAIAFLRSELRRRERRAETARRELDARQRDVQDWQDRADRAVEEGKHDLAQGALKRRTDLEPDLKRLEGVWWEAEGEAQSGRSLLSQLEDRAQEARRAMEYHIARRRGGRSSSDFIAVPKASSASTIAPDPSSVDAALEALKKKRSSASDESATNEP